MKSLNYFEKSIKKKSYKSIILNFLNVCFNFLIVFFLARFLEINQFGLYIYCISISMTLGLPVIGGIPYLIIKTATENFFRKEGTKNLLKIIININLAYYFLILLILLILSKLLNFDDLRLVFLIATLILSIGINKSFCSVLRVKDQVKSQIFELIYTNVLILFFIFLFNLSKFKIDVYSVFNINIFANFFIVCCILKVLLPKKSSFKEDKFDVLKKMKNILKQSWSFILIQYCLLLNSQLNIILIGIFLPIEIVGKFKLITQLSAITALSYNSVNKVITPRISNAFQSKNFDKIEYISLETNKITIIYSFFIGLFLILFGNFIISFFFGTDYLIDNSSLIIIILAQLISSLFGSVGAILNMCGRQVTTLKFLSISLIVNFLMSLLLIPFYGVMGCAISYLIATFIWKFKLWLFIKKELNIKCSYLIDVFFVKFKGNKN